MIGRVLDAVRRSDLGYQVGLIGFVQCTNLVRLAHYAIDIHPRYLPRLALVVGTSVCSGPLRLLESAWHGRRVARIRLQEPPIFIIGHWRSGTTHLHNLMTQDSALGSLSMYQAMVPNCSLIGGAWLKSLLSRIVPLKRPMDDMVWPVDAPQEEEIPLAKLMPHAFYTRFLFPDKAQQLFNKYVLMEGAPSSAVKEFKRKYLRLLQVASLHAGGKRLVLKNPVNTARVRQLLELFPDAKFIHVFRNPYDVFASTRHLHRKMLGLTTLQAIRAEKATDAILGLYEVMMKRYFAERSLIPPKNLVEVRFEDLERDPLEELRRVYDRLELPGFAEAEPAFRAYAASQKNYRKNRLELPEEDRRRVDQRWAFAFRELGYGMRGRESTEPVAQAAHA